MKDKQFVGAVFGELFYKNFEQYKEALLKPVNKDDDAYARARNALSLLDSTQKQDVIGFLKLVIADSASVILGTLDGVHYLDNLVEDFVLICDSEEIQGDLQDIFIDKAQEENVYGWSAVICASGMAGLGVEKFLIKWSGVAIWSLINGVIEIRRGSNGPFFVYFVRAQV